MVRKIIQIDEAKCSGCGACAAACHEGAIGMVEGKAKLLRDDYCDGLGNCLPACPAGAISFVEREAAAYDESAVREAQMQKMQTPNAQPQDQQTQCTHAHDAQTQDEQTQPAPPLPCGCPGTHARQIQRTEAQSHASCSCGTQTDAAEDAAAACCHAPSRLLQWPVQIKLVPARAPYFDGAALLIAADCTAYAYGNFHERFIRNRITLIGCPKLDEGDYAEKLTAIIRDNDIQSVTIARMEVPCCGGLEAAAKAAIQASGKMIPWQVAIVSTEGNVTTQP